MRKILIFTSKTGGGHVSLAEALRDWLTDHYEIEILDPQPGVIHTHYRLVSRHALWIWAAEFGLSDTPRGSRLAHRVYGTILGRLVINAIDRSNPDMVMSTYPFLTTEVMDALQKMGRRLPFVMLFSDPNGVHQSWLSEKRAHGVLAPTRETYQQALASNFSSTQVLLSGWPVRNQFYRDSLPSSHEIKSRIGLRPDRLTVFLQGGGEGAAKFVRTVEDILAFDDVQVILACGTNQALLRRFQNIPRVHALPFTKEIAGYMAAADLVMGKAGPNMLFEAVSLGKPFAATAYIPGQEQANLDFIRRHHLGWVALKPEEQQSLIRELIEQPARLQEARAGVLAYRQWNQEHTEAIPAFIDRILTAQ